MRSFVDNSQERQSRAIANKPEHQRRKGTYMVDNRPEAVQLRKMQEMTNNSPQAKRIAQFQTIADSSTNPHHVQLREMQEMIRSSSRGKAMADRQETVQKKGPEDEDELQFKAKDAVQLKGPEDEDELQLKSKEAVQKKGPEDEDELQFKAKDAVQLKGPEDEDELQFKAEEPVQKQENKTGLPDDLKAGVENLSGMAMDDVRVHYNSGKPAQLNAYAYTQGTEIHVAPGQEKHLPHEAWHVVQQKQGRVQPTMQMAGGVAVNDDQGLEKEADGMGRLCSHPLGNTINSKPDEEADIPIVEYRPENFQLKNYYQFTHVGQRGSGLFKGLTSQIQTIQRQGKQVDDDQVIVEDSALKHKIYYQGQWVQATEQIVRTIFKVNARFEWPGIQERPGVYKWVAGTQKMVYKMLHKDKYSVFHFHNASYKP